MKNKRSTGIARVALSVSMVAVLSACGHSKPSESDAQKAVQADLGDCKYVDMSSFDKVNGRQGEDENHYKVQIKYKLTLNADSDQKDKLETHLARLNERNDLIKKEEKIRVSFMSRGQGSDAYNDPDWKDFDERQKALYQQLTTTYGPATFYREVRRDCPNFPASVLEQIMTKTDDTEFDGKNTLDFGGTISMVKTDSGWTEDR